MLSGLYLAFVSAATILVALAWIFPRQRSFLERSLDVLALSTVMMAGKAFGQMWISWLGAGAALLALVLVVIGCIRRRS